jgi:predicted dehydrogenase
MGAPWADRVAESDLWQMAALVDVDRDVLLQVARRLNIPETKCFTSLNEALETVQADALLDVTPQQYRRDVCCLAFQHGLNVLAEKPMANSIREAMDIIECAKQYNRTIMISQNYRYQPLVQTVKKFIEEERVGQVGYVGVSFHKGPKFEGGYREFMDYPLVLDMSIHHFDMMRCILESDIASIQAVSIRAPWNWNRGDATLIAEIEMENSVRVSYHASWVATGWETPWNGDWRVSGSKGVLLWEQDKLMFSNKPGSRKKLPLIVMPKIHQAYLLDLFSKHLDAGTEPETSAKNNLNSFATTYAAIRSAEEGRRVQIRELTQ